MFSQLLTQSRRTLRTLPHLCCLSFLVEFDRIAEFVFWLWLRFFLRLEIGGDFTFVKIAQRFLGTGHQESRTSFFVGLRSNDEKRVTILGPQTREALQKIFVRIDDSPKT